MRLPFPVRRLASLFMENVQTVNLKFYPRGGEYGPTFKEFFLDSTCHESIQKLKAGMDSVSINVIDQKLEHLLNLPAFGTIYQRNLRAIDRRRILYTEEQNSAMEKFKEKLPELRKRFKLRTHIPEVTFYEHGLALCEDPGRLHEYLSGKVLLDCGASFGDSAVVLKSQWNFSRVFSFELTNDAAKSEEAYMKTVRSNSLNTEDFTFEPKGVGLQEGDGFQVASIDDYQFEGRIGAIKMDIEGAAYNAVRGATKTIAGSLPILLIACYHSPNEFFKIKPLIEDLNLGYSFHLRNLNYVTNSELETTLIAIPPELKGLAFRPM